MTEQDIKKIVEPIAGPLVKDAGLELIDVSAVFRHGVWTLEFLVDHEKGGINLDECAAINHKISEALEASPASAFDYEIVVASPGLDRPLKTSGDFKRVLGSFVRFVLKEKVQGKGEYSGFVKEVHAEQIVVKIEEGVVVIPILKIMKAVQII